MIQKMKTTDLKIGMYIDNIGASWFKHPFLNNKMVINSEDVIEKLIKSGIEYVFVDIKKSDNFLKIDKSHVAFGVEKEKAKEIYNDAKVQIHEMVDDVKKGKHLNSPQLCNLVINMASSIFRNDQALISLSRLKDYNEYIYNHSINVCLLCLAMGGKSDLDDEEMLHLGLGGLLHDVGLMRLPPSLLSPDHVPTEDEILLLRKHPHESAKILEKEKLSKETISIALHHHERFNGEGYPQRLKGKQIGTFGFIIRIADFYDHITNKWHNHEALPPSDAIKMILQGSQSHFSPLYASLFLECLGMYPIGTLVELNTKEIGIVMENNRNSAMRPRILLLTDAHGIPLMNKTLIDLSDTDNTIKEKKIDHALNPKSLGINPEEYLDSYNG
ncbi:MAG: HD-GYP domain-containing protein [bacterium]